MKIKPPYYPIIYVRGFAATRSEIEATVATPYMGFNLGATKIRQNHEGKILRWIFQSPLIRLMDDEGYRDAYRAGGSLIEADHTTESVPDDGELADPRTVWIFRYYDQASETLGTGEREPIEKFAADLRKFILDIRRKTCGDQKELLDAFKVHLVAHSMGGLICRSYLQRICRHGTGDRKRDKALELDTRPADPLVDKVFTYATPHNGIDFTGLNVPDLGPLSVFHTRNFNRDVMAKYLGITGDSDNVNTLDGAFPPDRFFCLVGTNYEDYEAFYGLSKRATGPMSDGLVMIENATVRDAPRAFVHRSHSGDYGVVNSEEGYQNLRRFLFGDVRVDALLEVGELTLPKALQKIRDEDAGKPKRKRRTIRGSYHIDTSARVRGAGYYLHERRADQASALFMEYDDLVK
ncbi:MAG: hypothetical protein PVH31_04315, partial [Ectothiorhodospiraceae bacterium]